jgi:acyl-coenzyme A thioesterase PaaI-like protein
VTAPNFAVGFTTAWTQGRDPFVRMLGFELLRFEPGEAEIALPLRPSSRTPGASPTAASRMTLLDVAMAHAARSPGADGVAETSAWSRSR